MATKQQATYRLKAKLPYRLERHGNWWVATCRLLGVSNQGKTEKSAERNLKHAIALKIQTELELGTLPENLRKHGFHPLVIGNKTTWGAASSGDEPLEISLRTNLHVKRAPPETPVRRETVPNLLPWVIDWNSSDRSSGRSRAA